MRPGLRPRTRPTRPLGVAVRGNSGTLISRMPGGLVGRPDGLRPVVALTVEVDLMEDAVKLVPAVAMGGPEVVEGVELRQVSQRVLRRLGHGHLPRPEAAVAVPRPDPESLRGFLEEEPRLLPGGKRRDEEAGREADRARGRRDEVGEIAEPR